MKARATAWWAVATAVGLALVAGVSGVASAVRPDGPGAEQLTFHYDDADLVETFDDPGGRVKVHFTREGDNAVRGVDLNTNGTPDDVELVGATYEAVLTHEASLGFRAPRSDEGTSGGDGKYDVYLLDFHFSADGTFMRERCSGDLCSGYMIQENDFAGYGYPSFAYATRVLASHETFHAVQAAYDDDQGANWSEATAVWATEQFDKSLDDFEGFATGWLSSTERSVDTEPTGPVDSFSYGMALVAQFLSERYGTDIIRQIWEGSENGAGGVADPHWVEVLAGLLANDTYDSSFAAAWQGLAAWTLRAGWGGAPGDTWESAEDFPEVTTVPVALPFSEDKLRVFHASLRVWSVVPGAREVIKAELVTTPEDVGELAGMTIVMGARTDNQVVIGAAGLDEVAASIDVNGAEEVYVAVVNTQTEGESQRPGLCIGAPEEVAACKTALGGDPVAEAEPGPEPLPEVAPESDDDVATTADAGDDAAVEGGAETVKGGDDGCAGGGAGGAALLLAALLLLRRIAQPRLYNHG